MITLVLVIVFFVLACVIVGAKRGDGEEKRFEQTIHHEHGSYVTHTYDDKRFIKYVNGHPCETEDEMTEWSVIYGFCSAIESTLREIEWSMEKDTCDSHAESCRKWHEYYRRYRGMCMQHRLWNRVIGDNAPFIPTKDQLQKESELLSRIDELSGRSDIASSSAKKKPVCPRKLPDDFAGPFDASMYADIDLRTKYKVRHTVGSSSNMDEQKGCCDYVSLSRDETYHTSLTQCTCKAYEQGKPCKHMVALAVRMHKIRI